MIRHRKGRRRRPSPHSRAEDFLPARPATSQKGSTSSKSKGLDQDDSFLKTYTMQSKRKNPQTAGQQRGRGSGPNPSPGAWRWTAGVRPARQGASSVRTHGPSVRQFTLGSLPTSLCPERLTPSLGLSLYRLVTVVLGSCSLAPRHREQRVRCRHRRVCHGAGRSRKRICRRATRTSAAKPGWTAHSRLPRREQVSCRASAHRSVLGP